MRASETSTHSSFRPKQVACLCPTTKEPVSAPSLPENMTSNTTSRHILSGRRGNARHISGWRGSTFTSATSTTRKLDVAEVRVFPRRRRRGSCTSQKHTHFRDVDVAEAGRRGSEDVAEAGTSRMLDVAEEGNSRKRARFQDVHVTEAGLEPSFFANELINCFNNCKLPVPGMLL